MHDVTKTKTVLITGGSRGVGKGIALVMAKAGYEVAFTYATQKDLAEKVADKIRKEYGRKCITIQANLEQEGAPARVAQECIRALGRIDVLVNNAALTIFSDILTMEMKTFDFLINLNFKGYILLLQAVARHMAEKKIRGNIINITSTRGQRAYAGDGIYGGIKAAISRATQSFALDLAPHGIRVNCIAPGAMINPFGIKRRKAYFDFRSRIPLKRLCRPSEIGEAVAWLVSKNATYITGQTWNIDGGLILPGMHEW